MANTPAELDYDMDEVMNFCKGSGCTGAMTDLVKDLNTLVDKLNNAEDHFHCKGGSDTNALMQIYNGFSACIGKSSGNNTQGATGVAALNCYAREMFQTCYNEAEQDKKALASYENIANL